LVIKNEISKEKIYDADEINFDGIELLQAEKERISHCINEILDFHFY
jgi:hypothetical protein